jgi:hypothetical protein
MFSGYLSAFCGSEPAVLFIALKIFLKSVRAFG